jgi:hypothetical protein
LESFDTVSNWIHDCENNHICSKRLLLKEREHDLQLHPARLVDVRAYDESDPDVRLVDNDGSTRKYITLSYCWGKSKTFTTTSRSLRLRKARIKFSTLPKTFQDSVAIARRLKVRWLWIDALCIVQDDRRDWERESAKMGAIYSRAYVTIAADSGVDCNSGCFNVQSTSQELAFDNVPFDFPSLSTDGKQSLVFLWDPSRGFKATPSEIDGSPLAERGWVCQERILSPRILHYTRSQLFWECRQVLLAEDNLRPWTVWSGQPGTVCGLAKNLYGTTVDPTSRRNLLNIWYNNVVAQSYSRRKLTLPDDKLTAISGIARAFGRHFHADYLGGLWHLDLPWGLSWRRRGPVERPVIYRAPSISWASLDAIVEWPVLSPTHKPSMKTEAVHVALASEDPFGRVLECWIIVTGHVHPATVATRKRMSSGGFDLVWELRSTSNKWLGTAFMDSDAVHDGLEMVEYLVLSHDEESRHSEVLLLEPKAGSAAGDEYVRKGVAEILGFEVVEEIFDNESLRTIKLL